MDATDYSRFTDRARRVIDLANHEAASLGHDCLAAEHILLGLASEGHGVAAHVLEHLGQDVDTLRAGVARMVAPGPQSLPFHDFPLTPAAKRTIEFAHEDVQRLGHSYVGTEHLLLGLMRVHDSVAVRLLVDADVDPNEVRNEVFHLLGHPELIEDSPGDEG